MQATSGHMAEQEKELYCVHPSWGSRILHCCTDFWQLSMEGRHQQADMLGCLQQMLAVPT